MDAHGKFGEHERSMRVTGAKAESRSTVRIFLYVRDLHRATVLESLFTRIHGQKIAYREYFVRALYFSEQRAIRLLVLYVKPSNKHFIPLLDHFLVFQLLLCLQILLTTLSDYRIDRISRGRIHKKHKSL